MSVRAGVVVFPGSNCDRDIAGILSANRRVLGLMPHPERAADPAHGGIDGRRVFSGFDAALAAGLLQSA